MDSSLSTAVAGKQGCRVEEPAIAGRISEFRNGRPLRWAVLLRSRPECGQFTAQTRCLLGMRRRPVGGAVSRWFGLDARGSNRCAGQEMARSIPASCVPISRSGAARDTRWIGWAAASFRCTAGAVRRRPFRGRTGDGRSVSSGAGRRCYVGRGSGCRRHSSGGGKSCGVGAPGEKPGRVPAVAVDPAVAVKVRPRTARCAGV